MLEVTEGLQSLIDSGLGTGSVFGMDALQHGIESRLVIPLELEDAIGFVGPHNLVGFRLPAEAASLAESLRLGQIGLAPEKLAGHQLVLGHVDGAADVFLGALGVRSGDANASDVAGFSVGTHDALRGI